MKTLPFIDFCGNKECRNNKKNKKDVNTKFCSFCDKVLILVRLLEFNSFVFYIVLDHWYRKSTETQESFLVRLCYDLRELTHLKKGSSKPDDYKLYLPYKEQFNDFKKIITLADVYKNSKKLKEFQDIFLLRNYLGTGFSLFKQVKNTRMLYPQKNQAVRLIEIIRTLHKPINITNDLNDGLNIITYRKHIRNMISVLQKCIIVPIQKHLSTLYNEKHEGRQGEQCYINLKDMGDKINVYNIDPVCNLNEIITAYNQQKNIKKYMISQEALY